ncbi:reverse transcriptase domain-containing protein [Tanacetum coccineum]
MVDILQVIESRNPTVGGPYHRIHKQGHAPLEQKEAREYAHGGGGTIVLSEIHAGSCSMHSGPRSVVARALRSGYYWPTMHRDARDMIRKCHDCQHRRIEILIVAIDYFTKWIEARAVATITGNQDTRRWVEELSHVLWAHRTTIKGSTGDTPFSLVYGTEAVIPAEIGMPTIRTAEVNSATNDDERRIDLDILEERREQAAIREEKVKLQMKGYYDAKVRGEWISSKDRTSQNDKTENEWLHRLCEKDCANQGKVQKMPMSESILKTAIDAFLTI